MAIIRYITVYFLCCIAMSGFASRGHLSEFDRTTFEKISQKAGVSLKYETYSSNTSWQQLLDDVKKGKYQVTGSATDIEERRTWAQFSTPYRNEEVMLYIPVERKVNIKNTDDFIKFVKDNPTIKIGIIDGWVQPTKELDDFVNDSKNSSNFIREPSDAKVANLLVYGDVDGVLLERACRHDNPVEYYPEFQAIKINAITPISFIFTKNGPNAVSSADLAKINKAIDDMTKSGELAEEFENYIND